MTRRFTRTQEAERDLVEIVAHIAADNPTAALRLSETLSAKSQLLTEFPQLGHADPARPGRRIHVVGNYLVLYRETTDGIDVLRYIYGRRDRRRL